MNISFTPANYRPNFKARFSDDERTKKTLREIAIVAPHNVYGAYLALRDNPNDSEIVVEMDMRNGQYDVDNITMGLSCKVDCLANEWNGLCDAIVNRTYLLFGDEAYVPEKSYTQPTNEAVRNYKKAATSDKMLELKMQIKALNVQIEELEEKRKPLLEQYDKMIDQRDKDVADAILKEIYA
ncbi:hypothetical protein J6A64_02810 [bacterium]|nr:hypothetical protein [bacterium]